MTSCPRDFVRKWSVPRCFHLPVPIWFPILTCAWYTFPMTTSSYNAVIRQDGQWWIGWIEEVPGVNCQGATREELLQNLRETLAEALEMNREDARRAAGKDFEEVLIQP